MTTIDDLIDALDTTPRGQVFLINLYHTLERRYLPASKVRTVCEEFLIGLTAGGHPLPAAVELADRLGETCVAKGLWQDGPEPILERYLPKREFVLTRVTSYGGFFFSVLKRSKGMPPIPDMPEPIDLPLGNSEEIDAFNIDKVRDKINSGKWMDLLVDDVRLNVHCIWLAPLPKLKRKIVTGMMNQADFNRDIIGLSHFGKGRHLIRLDFDLRQAPEWQMKLRRRPHGAANGGNRFRLKYDGRECIYKWGRTVDLSRVATKTAKSLNGIPELLMASFSIPKVAVQATYLGSVMNQPESNDSYFINRLRRRKKMPNIVADLKRTLI